MYAIVVKLRETMEKLILMRDVLKEMRWHKRLNKKLKIVGDLAIIRLKIESSPQYRKYPNDAKKANEALNLLEKAINDDNYLESRKYLDLVLKRVAALVASGEIESWQRK